MASKFVMLCNKVIVALQRVHSCGSKDENTASVTSLEDC